MGLWSRNPAADIARAKLMLRIPQRQKIGLNGGWRRRQGDKRRQRTEEIKQFVREQRGKSSAVGSTYEDEKIPYLVGGGKGLKRTKGGKEPPYNC